MKDKDQLLSVDTINDKVVISIGVSALIHAVKLGPAFYLGLDTVKIVNKREFIRELTEALMMEAEDGSTPLHNAFDAAATYLIEHGADSVQVTSADDDDEDYEELALD